MNEKITLYTIRVTLIEDGKYASIDINDGLYYLEYKFKKNLRYVSDCSLRLKKYQKVIDKIANSLIERGHKICEDNNIIANSFAYLAYKQMRAYLIGKEDKLGAEIIEEVDENGNKNLVGKDFWI